MTKLGTAARTAKWLPGFGLQWARRSPPIRGGHIIISVADHFEPSFMPETPSAHAPIDVQEQRLERWCKLYPKAVDGLRDSDGRPWVHTYFFPAEQYRKELIDRLAEHTHRGWGEIEVHLHHGVTHPATSDDTRRILTEFRDTLVRHGCLSSEQGSDTARYAFVHGNWALANSGNGFGCGVDDELQILAETGCYVDMTLPSAPDPTQIRKINALYECSGPLGERAAHRKGDDLRVGNPPNVLPLIFQGPLGLFRRSGPGGEGNFYIENGEMTDRNPPSMERLARWLGLSIGVQGRPNWTFIKLHCHGMDARDEESMMGRQLRSFLSQLVGRSRADHGYVVHFCTAREMVNIALAACDGRDGNPGDYRDYRFMRGARTA